VLLILYLLRLLKNSEKIKNRFKFISIFYFLCYNGFGDMMKKAKKVKSQKTNLMISTDNEMSKLIILILVVALIFAAFYVITLFVTKKDDNKSDDNNEQSYEATIQYDKILAGNIFSQNKDEYYVLAYFKDDSYVDYYKSYLSYYSEKVESAVPYYFVDLDDVFNSSFVDEKSNLNVTDVKKMKFSQTTLLRIKDGKVISSYEGNESITGKLGRMTK